MANVTRCLILQKSGVIHNSIATVKENQEILPEIAPRYNGPITLTSSPKTDRIPNKKHKPKLYSKSQNKENSKSKIAQSSLLTDRVHKINSKHKVLESNHYSKSKNKQRHSELSKISSQKHIKLPNLKHNNGRYSSLHISASKCCHQIIYFNFKTYQSYILVKD